jgi:hypothetical protein
VDVLVWSSGVSTDRRGRGIAGIIVGGLLIGWRARHPRRVDTEILDLREREQHGEKRNE